MNLENAVCWVIDAMYGIASGFVLLRRSTLDV